VVRRHLTTQASVSGAFLAQDPWRTSKCAQTGFGNRPFLARSARVGRDFCRLAHPMTTSRYLVPWTAFHGRNDFKPETKAPFQNVKLLERATASNSSASMSPAANMGKA